LQAAPAIGGIYTDISTNILVSANGVTNALLDPGAITNWPARFYRVEMLQ
jgi:hypothetical protein